MTIREMRNRLGDTQSEFSARYGIPFRTIQNWETGKRIPPDYVINLLQMRVDVDIKNRKTVVLPERDNKKKDLPDRRDYVGAISWLKAVSNTIGEPFVYALDEALMCQGYFGGRDEEYLIWVYGEDTLSRFNGVVVLGNNVSSFSTVEKNGLVYTDFNRTLADALANESILDMQGITEALSKYYYSNGSSFDGIYPVPEYQDAFEKLAAIAIEYYDS